MTRAPTNLLAARRLLLDHLGPGVRPRPGVAILDPLGDPPWEVGIVADTLHRGGYHCGSDRVVSRDYSVIESARDRTGLTLDAAALDVGMFKVRTPLGTFDLRHYSRWLVQQCEADTEDTRHIREVIYSPDGRVVRRWDRLRKRTSGDSSHLGHTHESYFRDAIKAGADLAAVKRRYLNHIGVLAAPQTAPQEDTMPLTEADANTVWSAKAFEYADEHGDGKRDVRTVKDILFATHAAAVAAANPERLAQRLAELLPAGTPVSRGDLEAALRTVLGSLDNPTPQE